jgi:flagellar basal-body rod modification protein FlgD
MSTAPVTSGASPLDINSLTNPATQNGRRINADLNGDQISSTTQNAGDQKPFADATKSLGKQDFLQLLVTQLKYQDPLSPEANTEFVAQLAQFSNLEGTQNINSSITDLGTKIETMVSGQKNSSDTISNASATSLIGKQVRVTASDIVFDPTATAPIQLNVHTDKNTNSILTILDDQQNIVNAVPITQTGEMTLDWNGQKMDGTKAPAGNYHLKVTTADGSKDTGYTYLEDKVTGISYGKDGLRLEVRGQAIPFDQVVHVSDVAAAAAE